MRAEVRPYCAACVGLHAHGGDGERGGGGSGGADGERGWREDAGGACRQAAAGEGDGSAEAVDGSDGECGGGGVAGGDGSAGGGSAEGEGGIGSGDGGVADGGEKAVRFIGEPGNEVNIGVAAAAYRGAVEDGSAAGEDIPERGVDEGFAGGIHELAEVGVGFGVVHVDDAIAEVADEEIAGVDAEACGGREGDAIGRVQIAASDSARDEVSVEIEDVNDAASRAGDLLAGVCRRANGVGNPDLVVEDMNGPGTVAGRQVGISKGAGEFGGFEVLIEDLNRGAGAKVGREKIAGGCVGVEEGEAGIAGS